MKRFLVGALAIAAIPLAISTIAFSHFFSLSTSYAETPVAPSVTQSSNLTMNGPIVSPSTTADSTQAPTDVAVGMKYRACEGTTLHYMNYDPSTGTGWNQFIANSPECSK